MMTILSRTPIFSLAASISCAQTLDGTAAPTSIRPAEEIELQRAAIAASLKSPSSPPFESIEDHRSYYYLHSGTEMIAKNSLMMAGFKYDEIEEEMYLDFLEDALERELERVDKELRDIKASEVERKSELAEPNTAPIAEDDSHKTQKPMYDYVEPDTRKRIRRPIHDKYDEEYIHFRCQTSTEFPSPKQEQKLNELRSYYWDFIGVNPPQDKLKFQPFPNVAVMPIQEVVKEENNSSVDLTHAKFGLFAIEDFKEEERIFSTRQNALFFQELSTWSDFLHQLPTDQDACLVLKWSYMQKLFGPGRWVVVLMLDQSTFMRELNIENLENESDNADNHGLIRNVELGHARSFDYYALKNITEGEEIISGIYLNTLKIWWGIEDDIL
mmetsp:Transcript_16663/g.33442  ORF Transcript_16663/g.33442 Transcript_16663/m.33442 type:complete len:385 (-) Transcript_16663:58-1212(-)